MAFGLGSVTADAGAVSGAQFIISLAQMITDREAVAAQIKEWIEERGKAEHALAELKKREQQMLHREQQATKQEEALQKREADVGERERQLTHATTRLEEQRAEFAALKADLHRAWAA
jgi:hypothetical protein